MQDVSKRLEKAEKHLQKGRTEAALEEYLAALHEYPKNDQIRQTAAYLCIACGRKPEAISLLSHLLNEQVASGDARGTVTYKKLAKIAPPTPFQMLQYAQLISKKDKQEALDAYSGAMQGFERLRQEKQAFSAAKEMVDLSPSAENLQRLGEKAAHLEQGKVAAESFVRLGILKEETSPGSGFEWFDRAYYYDAFNLQAILFYARGLFSHNSIPQCIAVLEHAIGHFETTPELRELYARALMAARRPADAEPYAWELFQNDPQQVHEIVSLIGAFLDASDTTGALTLARKLEQHETKAGRRREFISLMHEMADSRLPSVEFLEYLVELFNSANREQEYCRTLIKVFQLYYAEGKYIKAGEALDRSAEVDPYEPGHSTRLEMLRGRSIAFSSTPSPTGFNLFPARWSPRPRKAASRNPSPRCWKTSSCRRKSTCSMECVPKRWSDWSGLANSSRTKRRITKNCGSFLLLPASCQGPKAQPGLPRQQPRCLHQRPRRQANRGPTRLQRLMPRSTPQLIVSPELRRSPAAFTARRA